MVVGDDDLQPPRPRSGDLLDCGDATIDGQNEAAALVGEPRQRLAPQPVTLLEPARQVPLDLGSEPAQDEDGERGGADSVRVVVAVDADPLPARDRASDRLDRAGHVAEQERVVAGQLAGQKAFASSASAYPRRTRTRAVVSLTPSALAKRTRSLRAGTD